MNAATVRSIRERPEASVAALQWPFALAASVLCPVLLSLAFPKFNLGVLAFIALAPLFLLWSKASWKQAFWWGWLAGTIAFLLLFRWMIYSIGDIIGAWSILALVLLCSASALYIAGLAVLTSFVGRGEFRTIAVFAVPGAWLVLEALRTNGSLGVPFAELGQVGAHLPWLLPIAAYTGVYGLTAVVALTNGAVAAIVGGTTRARMAGAIVLLVLAALVSLGDYARSRVSLTPPQLRVAIAQGNISQREKWTPAIFEHTIATYAALTRQAAARGAAVVIWPETAITSYPLQDPALLRILESFASTNHVWIIAGTVDRPAADEYYNTLLNLTPDGSVAGVYHKRYLVPFAEYVPLDQLLRRFPLVNNASRFRSGPGPQLLHAAGFAFGTLICYESAFAPYARKTANAGADAIVVATDDAWFGTTNGPFEHADAAVIDALSTGRWIVRGADTGISEIIDPSGKVVTQLPLDQKGIVIADIGRGIDTPYNRVGAGWFIVIAFGTLLAGLVRRRETVMGWRSKRGKV